MDPWNLKAGPVRAVGPDPARRREDAGYRRLAAAVTTARTRSLAHAAAPRGDVVLSAVTIIPSLSAGFTIRVAGTVGGASVRALDGEADVETLGGVCSFASAFAVLREPVALLQPLAVLRRAGLGLAPPLRLVVVAPGHRKKGSENEEESAGARPVGCALRPGHVPEHSPAARGLFREHVTHRG